MSEPLIIETLDLGKSYGANPALRGLNLQVAKGSIHALLGKNGAGKTTLIKILLNMVSPDQGSACVFGLPANTPVDSLKIRRRLGFVSETKDLIQDMTVGEIIQFTAAFYPAWDQSQAELYRQRFDLPDDKRIKELSQGMRSKLSLLLVLCRHAELLILDEPTSGLDPAAAEEILQAIVSHVANENTTVLFSSHQIAEVEQIADHVTIIHQGTKAASGEIDALKQSYCRIQLVFAVEAPEISLHTPGIKRILRDGRTVTVISSQGSEQLSEEVSSLKPVSTRVFPMSLKDIFFEEVGKHE
ncbi:MAG: ABC transporter ATP-binding protein [Proteobacteria bacterium]|nr:ABC transporter ATP-binding protein [Pseudomonadota bacterium]